MKTRFGRPARSVQLYNFPDCKNRKIIPCCPPSGVSHISRRGESVQNALVEVRRAMSGQASVLRLVQAKHEPRPGAQRHLVVRPPTVVRGQLHQSQGARGVRPEEEEEEDEGAQVTG